MRRHLLGPHQQRVECLRGDPRLKLQQGQGRGACRTILECVDETHALEFPRRGQLAFGSGQRGELSRIGFNVTRHSPAGIEFINTNRTHRLLGHRLAQIDVTLGHPRIGHHQVVFEPVARSQGLPRGRGPNRGSGLTGTGIRPRHHQLRENQDSGCKRQRGNEYPQHCIHWSVTRCPGHSEFR